MKTWKLVSGILSMILFVIVTFQSCAAGVANSLEANGGDVRLGRCIRSDSDACGRYRIRGNEKFGEEGRKYRFDCSVRSGSTGRIYRFRKLLRSCNLVRLVPDQCGLGSCGDDKEQIKIIYI